jgi:hypothetical protein
VKWLVHAEGPATRKGEFGGEAVALLLDPLAPDPPSSHVFDEPPDVVAEQVELLQVVPVPRMNCDF